MHVIVENIAQSFGKGAALFSGVSFQLNAGEMVALHGPSGSGKTTMLLMLAKWINPTTGSITYDGIDKLCWVAQNPYGMARRTALDHVVLAVLAQGAVRKEAERTARDVMRRFNLNHLADREFRFLSGGESQRLMLATVVAAKPGLLLIDEPTAQLDPFNAASVIDVLQSLADDNRIVVVATHDSRIIEACSRSIGLRT